MYVRAGRKHVPLTRELAQWLSDLPAIRGDRDRDSVPGKRRIARLRNKLETGEFYDPDWATALCEDVLYRVNGGRSSKMLVEYDGEFPPDLMARILEFHCPTKMDLAILHQQFDSKFSSRTEVEKIRSLAAVEPQFDEISPTVIRRCVAGIAFYLRLYDQLHFDEDKRICLMHPYRDFIIWANAYGGLVHLGRIGVMAAMLATWTHVEDKMTATTFWSMVRDESAPVNTDSTRVLSRFLRDSMAHNDLNHSHWGPQALYVKSLRAWNAWRDDRPTDLKYHAKSPLPKIK